MSTSLNKPKHDILLIKGGPIFFLINIPILLIIDFISLFIEITTHTSSKLYEI